MRAAVINDEHMFEVRDVPDVALEPDQVRVEVAACGVCGSDVHMRNSGIVYPGMVMGHEMGGTVVEVGDVAADRTDVRPGDEVAVMPVLPCGTCPACEAGRPQVCANQAQTAMGLGMRAGGLAEYVGVWPGQLYRLPAGVTPDVGALAEPLAVGMHGVDRSELSTDGRAVVLGGGSIGVMTSLALRARGITDIVVSEPSPERREVLDRLGFTVVTPKQVMAEYAGPDVVFDTTGVGSVLSDAVALVRPGGTVMLMGVVEKPAQIMPVLWVVKEVDVKSVLAYGGSFDDAVDALGDGSVDTATLASEQVRLEETEATFRRLATADAPPKILIKPGV